MDTTLFIIPDAVLTVCAASFPYDPLKKHV